MIKVSRNEPLVRTRFLSIAPNLSESGHHSDSILINSTKPVRISSPFGLVSHQLHQTCPNQLTIRTRFTSVTPNLSESGHHSDSILINSTKPVRIGAPFGLDSYQFHQTCPNQGTIRTRFLSIPPNLSESGHHSDSFHINSTSPVRISLPFGLDFP